MPERNLDQSKSVIQGLELMIRSLKDLLLDIESGESIVSITIDRHADVKGGAPNGADLWETLCTGNYKITCSINIKKIKEAEEYRKASRLWSIMTN